MSPSLSQEMRVTIPQSLLLVVPCLKLKLKQKASWEDDKDVDMAEDSDTELLLERPFQRLTKQARGKSKARVIESEESFEAESISEPPAPVPTKLAEVSTMQQSTTHSRGSVKCKRVESESEEEVNEVEAEGRLVDLRFNDQNVKDGKPLIDLLSYTFVDQEVIDLMLVPRLVGKVRPIISYHIIAIY